MPRANQPTLLLIVGVVLIALNLRPALASVGPVAHLIEAGLGLSVTAVGLLTSLPLMAFATVSVFTPLITRRLNLPGALALALGLIAVGTGSRTFGAEAWLFGGTLLLGTGIALGNVLLPALVKQAFPHRSGSMTSLYSSAMAIGATVAAGLSVPLADQFGWRRALGLWAVLAVLALVLWLPQLVNPRHRVVTTQLDFRRALAKMLRSRLVWSVALFLGLQSLAFYVILAWLPSLLQARGYADVDAGYLLALSQALGILGSAAVPGWAGRRKDQRGIVWLLLGLEGIALLGLLWPAVGLEAVWVGLQGFALGGSFGLALLMLVVRAGDTQTATALSGVSQSLGYLVAAVGPALFGALHEWSGNWTVPLVSLLVVLVLKAPFGLFAARDERVTL